jgi:hypothetical protein
MAVVVGEGFVPLGFGGCVGSGRSCPGDVCVCVFLEDSVLEFDGDPLSQGSQVQSLID